MVMVSSEERLVLVGANGHVDADDRRNDADELGPERRPAREAQPRRNPEPRGPQAAAVVEPRHGFAVLVDVSLLLVADGRLRDRVIDVFDGNGARSGPNCTLFSGADRLLEASRGRSGSG